MLHTHVWCGCGKLSRKKIPLDIVVGYGVGTSTRLLCEWFISCMILFLLTSLFTGSVCQMFRAQVKLVTRLSLPPSSRRYTPVIEQAYNITLLNVHIDYL